MDTRRKIVTALILFFSSILAFASSLLVLKSTTLAIAAYVLGIGIIVLLIEPYLGLVNYLIFLYLRPQEFIPAFKGLPVMLIVGGATLVSTLAFYALRKKSPFKAPQDYLLLWFYAAIVASHLAHFYIGGVTWAADQFSSRLVVYFLITMLTVTIPRLRGVFFLLMLLTLFQAANGIVQYHTGVGIGGQEMVAQRIQGIGIFADPNNLAMTFLIILPFMYLRILKTRFIPEKVLLLVLSGVLIYALFLTNSRGGMIAFILLGALFFSRRFGWRMGLIGGVMMAGVLFVAGPSRMRQMSATEESAYGRVEAWAEGMGLIQMYPLFGVGAWRFTDYHYREAHNSFIQCASELGLFGLLPWILMFVISLKTMSFIKKKDAAEGGELALYAESVFYGIIAFAASAMWISRAYNDLFFILVALGVAVVSIFRSSREERYEIFERRDIVWGLVVCFGLLVLFKVYLIFYW